VSYLKLRLKVICGELIVQVAWSIYLSLVSLLSNGSLENPGRKRLGSRTQCSVLQNRDPGRQMSSSI
jgi:hypothetical protein